MILMKREKKEGFVDHMKQSIQDVDRQLHKSQVK
jgi:hypothetical protein